MRNRIALKRGNARLLKTTLAAVPVLLLSSGIALAAQTRLLETGSTLLYPLFNLWVPAYTKLHPDVQITTQGTGSGTGIAEAIAGVAQIGASDAYMSDPQVKAHPDMLNIALTISSQMVNYNIPGLNGAHLKFSGPVLAGIYEGKVKYWDDPSLAKLNPGAKLPHRLIVPIHRTDGSGDTFIFTQYLSFTTPEWNQSVAYGTTVSWPAVQDGIGAEGNPGMVNAMRTTPYSIAYVGISFKNATHAAHLGEAELENRNGKFVLPDEHTVQAAVNAMAPKTPPDERISLIYAPGADSYPIVNYEYAIVKSKQPSQPMASSLRDFLSWAISPSGGNAPHFMRAVGFVALPSSIAKMSSAQISKISSQQTADTH